MQEDILFKEAHSKLKTVRDFLRFGISLFNKHNLFYGHGTTNVHDEVVYLLLATLNLPLDVLEPYLDAIVLDSESTLILERFKKRAIDLIPAPYLTNEAIIQGYSFYVDERVIIPRSFIPEILLNDGLAPFIEHVELVHDVLDLCTGNGSIAVIAADYFYDSKITAVDIDNDALDVASFNIERYDIANRVRLLQSDLWDNLENKKFDLILANPPYVDKLRMDTLSPEYFHEPEHALFGGDSGLDLVIKIIDNAYKYLNPCGVLVVEMGDNKEKLENIYPNLPFSWLTTISGDGFVFALTHENLIANN